MSPPTVTTEGHPKVNARACGLGSEQNAGSGFYVASGKRWLDAVVSAAGLVLLAGPFMVVAVVSKLSSRGPVFYRQARVGLHGKVFRIVKFRTMLVDAETMGPGITTQGDPRVTSFGRLLRRFKIDEWPQLWNVLKGEMSFVGPRPELPVYVATYTESQRQVLSVRPGITDAASLAYRHEEHVLAGSRNPEQYYLDVVLPHKLALNLEYVSGISLTCDLSLIGKTLLAIFASPS